VVVEGKVNFVTVSREADRWYVSINVEQDDLPDPAPVQGPVVGVDLGLKTFATISDDHGDRQHVIAPKPFAKALKLIQRLSRWTSRKERIVDPEGHRRNSNNRRKAQMRLARQHRRVKNIRSNFLHETTTMLTRTKSIIVLEDLSVSEMLKNRKLARYVADAGFMEFRRQLEYKARWYGSKVVTVDRYFASSQICSACGARKPMPISERTYKCDCCGLVLDRDDNAADNLARQALVAGRSDTAMLAGINACGDWEVHAKPLRRVGAGARTAKQEVPLSRRQRGR
jgi:putative transposase